MKRILSFLLFGMLLVGIAACANNDPSVTDSTKKQSNQKNTPAAAGAKAAGSKAAEKVTKMPYAEALKKSRLGSYPQKTVGEAFDSYGKAVSKQWQEDVGRDGKFYVDYICWFAENTVSPTAKGAGVVKRGLDVKFVIQQNGESYIAMATKLFMKADGKIQSEFFEMAEVTKIIDAIYANQELEF